MSDNSTIPSGLTLHHLQRSQSERIIWLLEELQIPFNLVLHKRDPLLAPPSLRAVHELGSAPVIVDGDLTLSETMAITTYILTKYAGEKSSKIVASPDSANYTDYLFWLYYVLNTFQLTGSMTTMSYFDESLDDNSPSRAFPRARFQSNLQFVEKRLGNSKYLAGDEFSLADIMAIWTLTTSRTFIPYSLEKYPNILEYVERMTSREAYKTAMDKGDHGLPILNRAEPGERKAFF